MVNIFDFPISNPRKTRIMPEQAVLIRGMLVAHDIQEIDEFLINCGFRVLLKLTYNEAQEIIAAFRQAERLYNKKKTAAVLTSMFIELYPEELTFAAQDTDGGLVRMRQLYADFTVRYRGDIAFKFTARTLTA
ncbi:MAG: hypothetical protein ACYCSB_04125 [bacterium]